MNPGLHLLDPSTTRTSTRTSTHCRLSRSLYYVSFSVTVAQAHWWDQAGTTWMSLKQSQNQLSLQRMWTHDSLQQGQQGEQIKIMDSTVMYTTEHHHRGRFKWKASDIYMKACLRSLKHIHNHKTEATWPAAGLRGHSGQWAQFSEGQIEGQWRPGPTWTAVTSCPVNNTIIEKQPAPLKSYREIVS